jgi:hypothetical protein
MQVGSPMRGWILVAMFRFRTWNPGCARLRRNTRRTARWSRMIQIAENLPRGDLTALALGQPHLWAGSRGSGVASDLGGFREPFPRSAVGRSYRLGAGRVSFVHLPTYCRLPEFLPLI